MVAIIDYDAGNIKSVQKAIEYLGEDGSEWRFMRSDDGWDDQSPTHVWKTVHTYKVKEV